MIRNRRMKPKVFRGIMVTGIIGLYVAALGILMEKPSFVVIGIIAVSIAAFVGMDEDEKNRRIIERLNQHGTQN